MSEIGAAFSDGFEEARQALQEAAAEAARCGESVRETIRALERQQAAEHLRCLADA